MNEISIIILCRCKFQAARPPTYRIFINRINNGANAYLVKTEQKWHLALSRGKCIWLGISMTKDWTRLASEHPLCYEIDEILTLLSRNAIVRDFHARVHGKGRWNETNCSVLSRINCIWLCDNWLLLVSWKLKF